jgi:hypothetical protein
MVATIRLDLPHAVALGQIMGQIRLWLECEGVHAMGFKSAEVSTGMTVDVTFADDEVAERFRQQFPGPKNGVLAHAWT